MSYKWTVLFMVHAAKKETREHANALFDMLKDTLYSEEIKVLVLYGALQFTRDDGLRKQVTLKEIVRDETNDELDLQEIVPGFGAIDLGDGKNTTGIFSAIRERYPSDRLLLFTWDHGSGFGIFKTDPRERRLFNYLDFEMDFTNEEGERSLSPLEDSIRFSIIDNNSAGEGTQSRGLDDTGKAKNKKTKTSMLTNDELRNIIKYTPDAKKVDLLIMMNCAMQMIETGYALHDAVEYLIAPETCIFWAGYNYKAIINKLCTDPEIETEALGKYAIDTIKAYYYKTPCRKYFNDLVVSLVKPARSIAVREAIDEIAENLNNTLADSFPVVKDNRQKCVDFTEKYVAGTPYHYIDFLNYLSVTGLPPGAPGLEKAKSAVQEYVAHIIKGDNYSKMNEDDTGQANGFTIYYPPGSAEADLDSYYEWFYEEGEYQTLFAVEGRWKDFLKNYFGYDRAIINENNNS